MNVKFQIIEAGRIEEISLFYLKGHLIQGVITEKFSGFVDLNDRMVEIQVTGKSLVPFAANPCLTLYILRIEEPKGESIGMLKDKILVESESS